MAHRIVSVWSDELQENVDVAFAFDEVAERRDELEVMAAEFEELKREAIEITEHVEEEFLPQEFSTLQSMCKYYHDAYEDGFAISTCRHQDNKPDGCSWGQCKYDLCQYKSILNVTDLRF